MQLPSLQRLPISRLKKLSPSHILALGIGVVVFLIIVVGISKVNAKKNEFRTVNDPKKALEVANSLVEIVGKIYQLPNEIPTVATITDKKILPNDSFYQKAQNGDKILIFPLAHKIIMYRPSENKVIDVGEVEPNIAPSKNPQVAGTSINDTSSAQQNLIATQAATTPKILRQAQ